MTSTSKTRRFAAALAAAAATALVTAGAASADTYCVEQPSCSGTVQPDVQAALTAAAVSPVPDRIEVGPGSFYTVDGFIYLGAGPDNAVELVGAGRDQTELRGGNGMNDRPTLLLTGSAPAKVSDLTISVPSVVPPLFMTGLRIYGDAERINVNTGARSDGVDLLDKSRLAASRVSLGGRGNAVASVAGAATAADLKVDAGRDGTAAYAHGAGTLSVSHSKLSGSVGAFAIDGGTVALDDSLVLTNYIGLFGENSKLNTSTIEATNVTLVGTDPTVSGIDAHADGAGSTTNVKLTNSVIARMPETLFAAGINGGVATLITSHSAYDHAPVDHYGGATIDQTQANLDISTPGFVDLDEDDFHLLADSPLRDAGDPAPPAGLAGTDLAGNPRSVDGNADGTAAPDIGAFEFQPPAPPPPAVEPPVVAPVTPPAVPPAITSAKLTHRKFVVGRAPRRGTAFRIGLSKDARVKIVIRRAKHRSRAGTLKRYSHKGANRIAFSGRFGHRALLPGHYVATVTATDAASKTSKARTLRFTVLKG
jgi:hypothetical protein